MDFELSEDQRGVAEAVAALLDRHAGAERAIALAAKADVDGGGYDAELARALGDAGFVDLFREVGPLDAALLVEAVARAAGVVGIAAAAIVAPALLPDRHLSGPIALAALGADGQLPPIRFGAQAREVLLVDGEEAKLASIEAGDAAPLRSSFGYPFARLSDRIRTRAEPLGPGSGETLRRWWRCAVAVEIAGTLQAAFDVTLDYVKARRQFGRAIGSFQGVQHRLAQAAVKVQGTRWLALEAAHGAAQAEAVAAAAAYAAAAAKQVFDEVHQFSGAMGFTREHPLHVFSMRLQALRLELGGVGAHRSALAHARWSGT